MIDPMAGPMVGAVVVASTRAAAGVRHDETGPMIVAALQRWGFAENAVDVVADGPAVGQAIAAAIDRGARLVLTTGGTGLSPTDRTPEETRAIIDTELPGIAEAIRAAGVSMCVPTAMLSRGIAGVAGRTLVVNLPGSPGGVRDALAVLGDVVGHAIEQVDGGDH